MKQTAKFKLERETKNTVRYQEIEEPGMFLMMGIIYVQKALFMTSMSSGVPKTITVTLEAEDNAQ